MAGVAFVSFRLGGTDGVSIEAEKWAWAFEQLGWAVTTVAGEGAAARVLSGLAMNATEPPSQSEVEDALADADLVVVENLCSLPLNPRATRVVADALSNRRALLHHHDLPWQRPKQFSTSDGVPHDDAWLHVATSDLARRQLAQRGVDATTIHNRFDPDPPVGQRTATRRALAVAEDETLLLQPTRAIGRKNVPGGIALADAIRAVYWLLGPAEEGYDAELARLLEASPVRVIQGPVPVGTGSISDAYAACDVVALPSTWEGFGNPAIESATHRRPLAIGGYPVGKELEGFGFRWFPADDAAPLVRWLASGDEILIEHNRGIARRHFSLLDLPATLDQVLGSRGWT